MTVQKKILFWGTPEIAKEILIKIHRGTLYHIAAVITNRDAPRGRSQKPTMSPVKEQALSFGIPCFTPEKLDREFTEKLRQIGADLSLIVSYGKLLSQKIIDLPALGTYNLHFSLLPKYRGASPVQTALLHGEKASGISIFKLEEKLDTGKIYIQKKMDIRNKNSAEVFEEMIASGGEALQKFCEDICGGIPFVPKAQNEREATYCQKFTKSDGEIFPDKELSEKILRKWRAFFLWPRIFFLASKSGKRVILEKLQEMNSSQNIPSESGSFFWNDGKLFLKTMNSAVQVISAHPEGKKSMTGAEFWNYWKQSESL
ncbi:methionyl-tRNA formyltransferase [Candidatus Peregrinibacteria bacterium]|nr:methionyl-tRNA formyltransferase [Candidatus Peregrinibacteria bacterium]